MALSEDTQWGVGIGVVILGAIGSGVWYLSSNQTAMENRLRENITDTEERLAQRIERVDSRLTEQIAKVDTGLRAVEGETAPLAGLEARLTKTIESSETRPLPRPAGCRKTTDRTDRKNRRPTPAGGRPERQTHNDREKQLGSDTVDRAVQQGSVRRNDGQPPRKKSRRATDGHQYQGVEGPQGQWDRYRVLRSTRVEPILQRAVHGSSHRSAADAGNRTRR